ncbi:MAG TPA: GNAT family protein [Jatrophihabitans sp.]
MIGPALFRDQPVLTGELVRLEPLTASVLEDYLLGLADPELSRLTGSHGSLDREQVRQWLSTRAQQHDRADWAVLRRSDGAFLGEAVLNDLDTDNASVNYRIWLAGPLAFGKGHGTEATRLVLDYAFDVAGLHRVSLGVFEFNPRARRVYEKCGFQLEGRLRHALRWDGQWHDEFVMSVLSTDPRPGAGADLEAPAREAGPADAQEQS